MSYQSVCKMIKGASMQKEALTGKKKFLQAAKPFMQNILKATANTKGEPAKILRNTRYRTPGKTSEVFDKILGRINHNKDTTANYIEIKRLLSYLHNKAKIQPQTYRLPQRFVGRMTDSNLRGEHTMLDLGRTSPGAFAVRAAEYDRLAASTARKALAQEAANTGLSIDQIKALKEMRPYMSALEKEVKKATPWW